jgi:hypothetical protein
MAEKRNEEKKKGKYFYLWKEINFLKESTFLYYNQTGTLG